MDMVTNLTKTDGEKYLDGLKQIKRCTDEQLDELAITIQVCYNIVTYTITFVVYVKIFIRTIIGSYTAGYIEIGTGTST